MKPFDGTSTVLIDHLLQKEEDEGRNTLISRCKTLEFDDFHSKHATPKMTLVEVLHDLRYFDLAANVRRGVYDAE